VSLISRESNLRFERIESLYLGDFSGNRSVLFPSHLTRFQKRTRRGLSKTWKFWTTPFVCLCQTLYCETHTFRISSYIKRFDFAPYVLEKGLFQSKINFSEQIDFGLHLCDERSEKEQDQIGTDHTWTSSGSASPRGGRRVGSGRPTGRTSLCQTITFGLNMMNLHASHTLGCSTITIRGKKSR
jgi:hypothetical protein